MWQKINRPHSIVALIIGADSFSCAWIVPGKHAPLHLAAYEKNPLECVNAATMRGHLHRFVDRHQLKNSFCTIALQAPQMHEEFARLSTASPRMGDFSQGPLASLIWDYNYLHGLDDGSHIFYVRGIKKSILLEYELLARHVQLVLSGLTSHYEAQLTAYARVYGSAFRQSQRTLDLIKHNYHIAHSLSRDTLNQLLTINASIDSLSIDTRTHATLIGMYDQ